MQRRWWSARWPGGWQGCAQCIVWAGAESGLSGRVMGRVMGRGMGLGCGLGGFSAAIAGMRRRTTSMGWPQAQRQAGRTGAAGEAEAEAVGRAGRRCSS